MKKIAWDEMRDMQKKRPHKVRWGTKDYFEVITFTDTGEVWTQKIQFGWFTLLEETPENTVDIPNKEEVEEPVKKPKWHVYFKGLNVSKSKLNDTVKELKKDIPDVDKIKAIGNKKGKYTFKFTNVRGD